jgi:D-amino peptidase
VKAFICTDLEGVAGVVSFADQTYPGGKYVEQANHLLTAEVSACVQGLLEAGVADVLVFDGHGPGAIVFEELHPDARLIHGRPLDPGWRLLLDGCDVALLVGQHAMAGVPDGNLNHTQNSRAITSISLNGKLIGETGQFALLAGSCGVPVILLSGDEAGCREARDLIPGITTVAVKQGLGRNSAISIGAVRAREMIREGAVKAIERHRASALAPLSWPGPYVLEKRYFSSDLTEQYRDAARYDASIEIVDPLTVRIRKDDIRAIVYA